MCTNIHMKKILICGDSFCVPDKAFPNLHWTEKLLAMSAHIEIWNFASRGASNALITMQLLQGLKLQPDFVILSFTGEHRYEKDRDEHAVPYDLNPESISAYLRNRYLHLIDANLTNTLSTNFEKIKNYFYIIMCLQTLTMRKIDFCFSLGGFEYRQDYASLLRSNFLRNDIMDYAQNELAINLWEHMVTNPRDSVQPKFHVRKEEIHTLFANECLARVEKATC